MIRELKNSGLTITEISKRLGIDRYAVIDKLWKDKATSEQVIEKLGPSYEKINDGIIYRFTGYKAFESGLKRLVRQVFFRI